jgi:2,4-dienoyl-CoA reductase-like NADH-dependent reductase (Old Yellow Enzyme family)
MTDHNALFSPMTFGPLNLKHRVIMAPHSLPLPILSA